MFLMTIREIQEAQTFKSLLTASRAVDVQDESALKELCAEIKQALQFNLISDQMEQYIGNVIVERTPSK